MVIACKASTDAGKNDRILWGFVFFEGKNQDWVSLKNWLSEEC